MPSSSQFQTFFQRNKASSSAVREINQRLYPVLSGEKILAVNHRKKLLHEIRLLVHLPGDKFRQHYQQLLNNFSEFVQLLPQPLMKNFQRDGGILDYALERTLITLQIRKDFKLPPEAPAGTENEQHHLWTYALFSGTLLYQLGEQIGYYRVHLFDEEKQFMNQWQPYSGSMLNKGQYYKYWLVSDADARRYRTTSSLYARQIMPEEAFAWLASSPILLDMWLALLNGDLDNAGILQTINSRSIKKLASMSDKTAEEIISLDGELLEHADEVNKAEDTSAGEAFLAWLIQGIEDKSISINQSDSLVHIVDKGIFLLHPEIFKRFTYSHADFPNWIVIQKQFNALGFAKLSGHDYRFEQYFTKNAEATKTREGLLIEDSRGVFFSNKALNLSEHLKPVAYALGKALETKAEIKPDPTKLIDFNK